MEFRRIEVKKVLRHCERITDQAETKKILESVMRHCLPFSAKIDKIGPLRDCRVISLGDNAVEMMSKSPQKVRLSLKFGEIEAIEVESNCDFVAEEQDNGGRWSGLMPGD